MQFMDNKYIQQLFPLACHVITLVVSKKSWSSTKCTIFYRRFILCITQVWSQTQLYYVSLLQARIIVRDWFFYKCTIKVCLFCVWRCSWYIAPSAPQLMKFGPWWTLLKPAQNTLQRSETKTRALLEGIKVNNILPNEGSLICSPGKSMICFYK